MRALHFLHLLSDGHGTRHAHRLNGRVGRFSAFASELCLSFLFEFSLVDELISEVVKDVDSKQVVEDRID